MKAKAPSKLNTRKEEHLDRVSRETSYPSTRRLVRLVANIFYALAVVNFGATLITALYLLSDSAFGMIDFFLLIAAAVISAIIWIIGRIIFEVGLVLVDVVDSILDINSRYEER